MQFEYQLMPHWPKLAWEAACEVEADFVHVRHGSGVETQPDWFCEAAWDGPFPAGNFDETDIVVGSGGRLRGESLVFVTAGNTVDRLQSVKTATGCRVSNSLPCLIAGGGIALDPSYRGYYEDFRSVIDGLDRLKERVHTVQGEVRLHYFRNIKWDGSALAALDKPGLGRDFSTFELFDRFLEESLGGVSRNAADPARNQKFAGLGTISTGYDSPTVAVLASRVWAFDEALTFTTGRGGHTDDGGPIAHHLGLRSIKVEREAYRALDRPEIPFLASNAYGEESHFAGAAALLEGRILYTGFHGDKVWAKDAKDVSPHIVRGDPTGLALSEYRLRAGFLHCPVPYWGVRQIADFQALSNSPDMEPWDVSGDYSRPLCRRIVEQAGVERAVFGQNKIAASVTMFNPNEKFLTQTSLQDFLGWLADTPGAPSPSRHRLDKAFALVGKVTAPLLKRLPGRLWGYVRRQSTSLFHHLFPWAAERAAQAYWRPE